MSNELLGAIGIVVMFFFLACRMWIGSALSLAGFLGILIMRNSTQALMVIGSTPFSTLNNYNLTVVPMFVLMGIVISQAGIGTGMFRAINPWIGCFRGGLASATVVASGLLGAITGSHMAGTIIMSKIALPEMQSFKYDDGLACGAIAGGAPLSIIIPPSIPMIMYGIITEENIGKLFIAGVIPGLILMAVYSLLIYLICRRRPKLGPAGERIAFKDKISALTKLIPMVVLFLLVLGGIYGGFFTTTEAGAVGALGAIIIAFAARSMNYRMLKKCIVDSAQLTGTIFLMLIGTYVFIYFVALSKIPFFLSKLVMNLNVPNEMVILAIAIIYVVLGMFMPDNPMTVLTVPILYPVVSAIGIDGIWFGIFVVFMMALGSITPPVGMVVFLLGNLTGVPVNVIFKGSMPFIAGMILVIFFISLFPGIVTFLPGLM